MSEQTTTLVRAKATVWSMGGRRYLSRRAAVAAYARDRMRDGHRIGDESDGFAPCVTCRACADEDGRVLARYVRFLMRLTKPARVATT